MLELIKTYKNQKQLLELNYEYLACREIEMLQGGFMKTEQQQPSIGFNAKAEMVG